MSARINTFKANIIRNTNIHNLKIKLWVHQFIPNIIFYLNCYMCFSRSTTWHITRSLSNIIFRNVSIHNKLTLFFLIPPYLTVLHIIRSPIVMYSFLILLSLPVLTAFREVDLVILSVKVLAVEKRNLFEFRSNKSTQAKQCGCSVSGSSARSTMAWEITELYFWALAFLFKSGIFNSFTKTGQKNMSLWKVHKYLVFGKRVPLTLKSDGQAGIVTYSHLMGTNASAMELHKQTLNNEPWQCYIRHHPCKHSTSSMFIKSALEIFLLRPVCLSAYLFVCQQVGVHFLS